MFWPPQPSVEISVSSENSPESTLETSESVVIPLSQVLFPPSEFAPLSIGAEIGLDMGVDSPSPVLA